MWERIETNIGLLVSVLSALTALLAAATRLLQMVKTAPANDEQNELEKDIVRLDRAIREQHSELIALRNELRQKQMLTVE
jgi:hypothetical protein